MSDAASELRQVRRWSENEGLKLPDESWENLIKYLNLLKIWAKKIALVSTRDLAVLISKHLADSLYTASRCPEHGRAADLGSGGGLPGVPIAIARPDLEIDLIESRSKKVSFLTQACQDLPNARPLHRRIEDLEGAGYELATARALAPLERLLPLTRPLLAPKGLLLAMKAETHEQELSAVDLDIEGFDLEKVESYVLPSGETRQLLSLRRR